MDQHSIEDLLNILRKGAAAAATTEASHENHDHRRKRRSTHQGDVEVSDHDEHHDDHDDHDDHDNHDDEPKKIVCAEGSATRYSSQQILEAYDVPKNVPKITDQQFYRFCPALIQQSLTEPCRKKTEPKKAPPSLREIYGYGFLATAIITAASLVGVVMVPFLSQKIYGHLISMFICLAIGTLVGDALLHLIPLCLGLHAHDSGNDGHEDHEEEGPKDFIWKMFVVFIAIYVFYLLESFFSFLSRAFHNVEPTDEEHHGHGHSHHFVPKKESSCHEKEMDRKKGCAVENPTNIAAHSGGFVPEDSFARRKTGYYNDGSNICDDEKEVPITSFEVWTEDRPPSNVDKPASVCSDIPTVALLILVGDSVHNFVDGIAIAAAFSGSLPVGVTTAVAILLHELPHEFGDFAVFISSGMGYKKALFLNFISGLMAFFGFFLGVQVATNPDIQLWIMAVTAGMFLYVALVNMLPEVMHNKNSKTLSGFLLQNLGIWVGITIMVLIAVYEDEMH